MDECGAGEHEALVLIDRCDLVDTPAVLWAHLMEPPREGLVFAYGSVALRLVRRGETNPGIGPEYWWQARVEGQ